MRFLRALQAGFDRCAPGAGLVLPWAGGLLLLLAAVSAGASWVGIRNELRATATVTENISTMTASKGVVYSPRLRFRSPGGGLIQVLADEGSAEAEFPAGVTVPVLYPAGHPEWARIATVWRVYWLAIVLGVSGVVLFDVGFLLRIILRRQAAVEGP